MNTHAAFHKVTKAIDSAELVVVAFQALRDQSTVEQWNQLCENQLLDVLLSACTDLEHLMEG